MIRDNEVTTVLKLLLILVVIIDLAHLCRGAESTKNEDLKKSLVESPCEGSNQGWKTQIFRKSHHYALEGNERMQAQEYDDALQCYNMAIKKNPKRWSYFGLRGICQMEMGKMDDAIMDFRMAVKIANDPESTDREPDLMNNDQFLKMGNALCETLTTEQAIWCFNKAIKIDPFNGRRQLGECYSKLGKWELAITNFRLVLEEYRHYAEDRQRLAQALLENKNFNAALEEISRTGNTGEELVNMGDNLKNKNRNYEEALKFYNKAIEISPIKNAQYYQKRGICHMELKEYNMAASDFREVININPQIENGYNYLTEALFYSGQRNEAIQELTKIDHIGLEILGWKLLRDWKYSEALDCFNEAIGKYPDVVHCRSGRASCHRKLGNLKSAIEDIKVALLVQPENNIFMLDLCEMLLDTHSYKEAKEVFEHIERNVGSHFYMSSADERFQRARKILQDQLATEEIRETNEGKQLNSTTPKNLS